MITRSRLVALQGSLGSPVELDVVMRGTARHLYGVLRSVSSDGVVRAQLSNRQVIELRMRVEEGC